MEAWNRKQALRSKHFNILAEQEIYWKQRSRIQWLKEGDLNTSFFHKMANYRRRINTISSLLVNDAYIDSLTIIYNAIEKHFFSLFNKPPRPGITLVWDLLLPIKVSEPDNLEIPFSKEEIKRSVFSLPWGKFQGPDGFPLCFYHHFWDEIMKNVFDMFEFFYQSNDINTLQSVNQTFITLIPKKLKTEKI